MLNLNKRTKTKPERKLTLVFKNCSCACASLCINVYTTQHRTVLIIFHLILQTTIIAQMMSAGGRDRMFDNYLISNIGYGTGCLQQFKFLQRAAMLGLQALY